jgi:hypothetical protein
VGNHLRHWFAGAASALAVATFVQPALAQDDTEISRPAPEEMRAQLEFSVAGGHFEMREYPAASMAIASTPARVAAEVEIFLANRDPQFSSTVGFYVFDETFSQAIRLMLSDRDGDLRGDIELIWGQSKSIALASFNPRLRARDVTDVVITRPEEGKIDFTVGNRTRTFDIDFVPAHVVFQAVGVDGFVEFTDPPQE